ncbi:MAG: hypothetical protein D3909_03985 [Candidatus Electrothrix sp. ATG1]|nr:hypothetical protein [Candidatus Electrothrix sp. ATG1]
MEHLLLSIVLKKKKENKLHRTSLAPDISPDSPPALFLTASFIFPHRPTLEAWAMLPEIFTIVTNLTPGYLNVYAQTKSVFA